MAIERINSNPMTSQWLVVRYYKRGGFSVLSRHATYEQACTDRLIRWVQGDQDHHQD
jgi:hypothetical protein